MAKIRETLAAAVQAITSGSVRERIEAERKRLADEAEREKVLTEARVPVLEAGDDVELDKIEAQINDSRAAQLRIQERIELLATRLSEREKAEDHAKIEALRERAEKLREFGERLIREDYAKAADALAQTLHRLRAVDALIEGANRTLDRAGVATVAPTNAVRCTQGYSETVKRKRRVGLGERAHPYYGLAFAPHNMGANCREDPDYNPEVIADNGERTHVYVDIEETVQLHHPAEIQDVLHQAIEVLPSATKSTVPLYDNRHPISAELLDALRAEFGI